MNKNKINVGIILMATSFLGLSGCSQDDRQITSTYMDKRNAWVLENAKLGFSHDIVLTEEETKFDSHIKGLILDLQKEFLTSNKFYPAQIFSEIKTRIETSPLFQLLKPMPKGGMLHIHVFATGDATRLVEMASRSKDTYIYLHEDGPTLIGTMGSYPSDQVPQGYRSMHELSEQDPHFISKVVEMITITTKDATSDNPWNKFNDCFQRIVNLFFSKPLFLEYYLDAFERLAADGIDFVELRTTFDKIVGTDGQPLNKEEMVDLFRQIRDQMRLKYPHFNLKLIISDLRNETVDEGYALLEEAYQLKSKNEDMVVGYDLVGFETLGHKTVYYLDNWVAASLVFENKYQVSLPYYFHDGESNWGSNDNLYDAILLETKRIGHAFNLFFFPWLQQQVKTQNICLEICPISNQMLGYVSDLRLHPAIGYLKQGIPCVLSSDDPMIFGTSGLSYDLWEAIMAWQLGVADIKQLLMNSILYSTLDEQEKEEALSRWNASWNSYVHEMVSKLDESR